MNKRAPLGLIIEGNAVDSRLLRLPRLGEDLGPVRSSTTRVARRVCTLLRGGYPVPDYSEFGNVALTLIHVEDALVPGVVEDLCAAGFPMRKSIFALCETWLSSAVLAPLHSKGAATATVLSLPHGRRNLFVTEGQPGAVRALHRVLENHEGRPMKIEEAAKDRLFVASVLSITAPAYLLQQAQTALRKTGMSGNNVRAALEEMVLGTLRNALKGGRASGGGRFWEGSGDTRWNGLEIFEANCPDLARKLDMYLQDVLTRGAS